MSARHISFCFCIVLLLTCTAVVSASSHGRAASHYRGSYGSHSSHRSRSYTPRTRSSYSSHVRRSYAYHPRHSFSTRMRSSGGSSRTSHGRIKRSEEAKDTFKRQHPCPSTGRSTGACPGYVIDHRKALACGGLDDPANMQWQTVADGKAKDRWERKDCR
jgi:hypothetical protein